MNKMTINNMELNLNLDGSIISIIGPSNSGKTYLLKKIINVINNDDILLDGEPINEYDSLFLRNNIAVVLDDDIYKTEIVTDELYYYLDKLMYNGYEIALKIEEFSHLFDIKDILGSRLDLLPIEKKILIKILSLLIIKPKVFGIDNLLIYLNNKDRKNIIKYIKDNNITLINVTSNSEDLLISDNIVVLSSKKVLVSGSKESILEGNSILPYLGLELPFITQLSKNLITYDMINKTYYDNRKLVDKIWK